MRVMTVLEMNKGVGANYDYDGEKWEVSIIKIIGYFFKKLDINSSNFCLA